MPGPRKVFRIEETAALRLDPPMEEPQAADLAGIMRELAALRAVLIAAPPRAVGEAGPLRQDDNAERLAAELRSVRAALNGIEPGGAGGNGASSAAAAPAVRIPDELEAVMAGSEQATQKILAAAEDIDQAANNLSAALAGDIEQGLAQDIRDRVIQIFEACNYQDLTSQRVTKVMAALRRIERRIERALDAGPPAHGPRLEGDRGHASQAEIDSIFRSRAKSA